MMVFKKEELHIENISIQRLEPKCEEWEIDTLRISTSRNCVDCSGYNGKIYSLYGWNKEYPQLPEILLKRKCPECNCCIGATIYFPNINDPIKPSQHFNRKTEEDGKTVTMANYSDRISNKKKSIALFLCVYFGWFGLHQYYVGNFKKGLLYTFTMGLFIIGWFCDIFKIFTGNFRDNTGALLKSGNSSLGDNGFVRLLESLMRKKVIEEENYYVPRDFYTRTTTPTYNSDYDSMDGHQFEYFCADTLKKNGFINVEVTQGSGDHGIDVLAEKDGITYAIQCKCYSSNIGNAAVQQAHTGKSLYRKDIAVVMTNRYFTSQATEEANSLGVKLWDRDKLNEMLNA